MCPVQRLRNYDGSAVRALFLILILFPLVPGRASEFEGGLQAFQSGSLESAKTHFEAYLKTNPTKHLNRTLFYLAQLEADGQKSKNYYQALVAKFPKDTLSARGHFALGQIAYAKGDFAEARNSFSKVLSLFPILSLASESQYWLGICSLCEEKPESARKEFFALIKEFPKAPRVEWARLAIAESYFKKGIYNRALSEYQDCEARYPTGQTLPIVLFQLGQCYEKLSGKEEAKISYERVLEIAPQGYEAIAAKQRLAILGKQVGEPHKSVLIHPAPLTVSPQETINVAKDTLPPLVKPPRDFFSLGAGIYLQVAAFTTQESSSPLKERLAQRGYPMALSTKTVSGRKYYTVLIGPFTTEPEAQVAESKLKEEEHVAPIWIRR